MVSGDGLLDVLARGCATSATDRPPGSPRVPHSGRPGQRRRPGPGRSPRCPGARVTTRRTCQRRGQRADRWAGECRYRPAPCHRHARGAPRSHPPPAPSRCRSPGRAGPESTATPCSGSPVTPVRWPAGPRPDRPTPARSPPACPATTRCTVHTARCTGDLLGEGPHPAVLAVAEKPAHP